MANTYTWNTKTVDVYPEHDGESDVVYVVHWRLNATSSEKHEVNGEEVPYTSDVYGTQSISTDDIANFIPFADLTEATTKGWVEDAMGATEVQSLKNGLKADIDGQITPTSETKTIGG
jgi:hypothetical protein|tara:strand:+ start:2101 stop:2454 length:354 start_codon:yes stop_codon:yes gene_type:complete